MKKYSLTSLQEPSEKQISCLMKEVVYEAKKKSLEAKEKMFKKLEKEVLNAKKKFKVKK